LIALKRLKWSKSPGPDLLSIDLLKTLLDPIDREDYKFYPRPVHRPPTVAIVLAALTNEAFGLGLMTPYVTDGLGTMVSVLNPA